MLTPEVLPTIIIVVGLSVAAIITLKSPLFHNVILNKHLDQTSSLLEDLEEENKAMKKKIRGMKLQENARDRGPVIEDKEFDELVPELVGQIAPFVPKRLQPLFENKEISGAIVKKVLENPDQYKDLIKKFIGKKNDGNQTQQESLSL